MSEATRAHQRIARIELPGNRLIIESLLPKPVELFVPPGVSERARLLLHFHGASFIPNHAASNSKTPTIVAAVHLGAGSGIYASPFEADSELFSRLVEEIRSRLPTRIERIDLSCFSAGYGAIRTIISSSRNVELIDGILLLDGLHTSYVPEKKVLAEGGALDEAKMQPFVHFAELASRGEKRMVVTHSEIFPGTFASTTETAEYLLQRLGIPRTPVLKWGPLGMQQLSESRKGSFLVLGFAGNTAPDHIDHFHGMSTFLELLD